MKEYTPLSSRFFFSSGEMKFTLDPITISVAVSLLVIASIIVVSDAPSRRRKNESRKSWRSLLSLLNDEKQRGGPWASLSTRVCVKCYAILGRLGKKSSVSSSQGTELIVSAIRILLLRLPV